MAFDDGLMFTLFQVLVVFLLLLLIAFAVPQMQPILYTSMFLIVLLYFLTTVLFPFGRSVATIFEPLPEPFTKLLIGSAILYWISELIAKHIEEAGFSSLAMISHLAVKIAIIMLWLNQTAALIETLSLLIKK